MKTKIEPFQVAHYAAISPDLNAGVVNQLSGPGYTLMTDERKPKILACGGVRITGIGQAWAVFDHRALAEHPVLVGRHARLVLDTCIAEENLYRVYAEASEGVKGNWFKHLGFFNSDKLFVR